MVLADQGAEVGEIISPAELQIQDVIEVDLTDHEGLPAPASTTISLAIEDTRLLRGAEIFAGLHHDTIVKISASKSSRFTPGRNLVITSVTKLSANRLNSVSSILLNAIDFGTMTA